MEIFDLKNEMRDFETKYVVFEEYAGEWEFVALFRMEEDAETFVKSFSQRHQDRLNIERMK